MACTDTAAGTAATDASASSPAAEAIRARDDLEFMLVMGALYHRDRIAWLAMAQRMTMFVGILASTGAVTAIAAKAPMFAIAISLLTAAASSLSLVFDFGGAMRRHAECRRFDHDLAAELAELAGGAPIAPLRAKMIRASGSSPVVFEVALRDAHNAAIRSLGRDPDGEFDLKWWHCAFRHVWPFRGTNFLTRREVREMAESQAALREEARKRGAPC